MRLQSKQNTSGEEGVLLDGHHNGAHSAHSSKDTRSRERRGKRSQAPALPGRQLVAAGHQVEHNRQDEAEWGEPKGAHCAHELQVGAGWWGWQVGQEGRDSKLCTCDRRENKRRPRRRWRRHACSENNPPALWQLH